MRTRAQPREVTRLTLSIFFRSLETAETLGDLHNIAVALRDRFKVDHLVYHWVSAYGAPFGFGTYPLEWAQRYVDQDYLRIDPVILGAFQKAHPVDWKRLDWSSKPARLFRQDAISFGIGNQGYSVPVRGPNGQFALLSVSHTCSDDVWEAFTREHQRDFILVAHYFNQKALEFETDRVPDVTRPLSPREVDALTFIAMGYTRATVSDMLSISEHTLRAYLESARFKLGAANTIHAVAKAIADGHILIGGASQGAEGPWLGREEHLSRVAQN